MLEGKKLIVGITGSIAAYKSAFLVRELIKSGADVKVIMTQAACDFISPLTLSTLSKNPVMHQFSEDPDSGHWNNHVDLGIWADALLIAPLSANTLAKMVTGVCDNLLMATFLSAKCPVLVAPAMDLDMYSHETTKINLSELGKRGVTVIEATSGELASGLVGQGRMEEPLEIIQALNDFFLQKAPLRGKKILITAGPTHEALDPVRFLGNRSSGKMGYSLAEAAAELGAEVTLISGPVALSMTNSRIQKVDIVSAADMKEACDKRFDEVDAVVMAAAVADYRPTEVSDKKIKKKEGDMSIQLERTDDILAGLGKRKKQQVLVGFALETNDEEANAERKLLSKNLDLIVMNSLRTQGAGFQHDTNQVTIFDKNNNKTAYELKSKREVALDILAHLIDIWKK